MISVIAALLSFFLAVFMYCTAVTEKPKSQNNDGGDSATKANSVVCQDETSEEPPQLPNPDGEPNPCPE